MRAATCQPHPRIGHVNDPDIVNTITMTANITGSSRWIVNAHANLVGGGYSIDMQAPDRAFFIAGGGRERESSVRLVDANVLVYIRATGSTTRSRDMGRSLKEVTPIQRSMRWDAQADDAVAGGACWQQWPGSVSAALARHRAHPRFGGIARMLPQESGSCPPIVGHRLKTG